MVGHNPGFEELLTGVLRQEQAATIQKMATGTLAVIEFSNGFSKNAAKGTLIHLVTRKDLSLN